MLNENLKHFKCYKCPKCKYNELMISKDSNEKTVCYPCDREKRGLDRHIIVEDLSAIGWYYKGKLK